jgi:protein-L-isoaspartate(D-aspartate) O-methyltransferase
MKTYYFLFRTSLFLLLAQTVTAAPIDYEAARAELIEVIEQDVHDTSLYLNKSELNPEVLKAMATVPRHEFVPEKVRDLAYKNIPLPIGHGQTISQPYIVAIMTDLLNIKPTDRVLEIGTGSGYQAAILSQLVETVYSIEIIEPLAKRARRTFDGLFYNNIITKVDDGYYGWQEHASFDAIIVTAAASHIPPPLIKQLKPGGSMIIPVGGQFLVQQLVLINKDEEGKVKTRQVLPVQFVPLTGEH